LVLDLDGKLSKIQVKSAWFNTTKGNFVTDVRRTKTNRKEMVRSTYQKGDFDFAIIYLSEVDVFYIIPFDAFVAYGSEIRFVENEKRQRKPKSAKYREAWALLPLI
jgi:hypothetical protein